MNLNTNLDSLLIIILGERFWGGGAGQGGEAQDSPSSLTVELSSQIGNVADPWLTPYGSLSCLFQPYLFFYQAHTHKCLE